VARQWRQLRWRIVAAQMAVVLVGVLVLVGTAELIGQRTIAGSAEPILGELMNGDAGAIAAAQAQLQRSFRDAISGSLVVAAAAAIVAGLATSLLLMREILRPLRELGRSSRRIAAGHYDERVRVPASDELAAVATSFNQMAGALEQVEQQRVALIGNVAHELRTPLSGLEGYLEGLIDEVFRNEPATFHLMQREVRRLKRLVDDLQALSRVEAGQIDLHVESFDLHELARRVIAQVRPQIVEQCLEGVLAPDADTPLLVRADPDRTAQVLLNLLSNALRYTPANGCITVRIDSDERMARVAVEDTGAGIPPESLPYLFERFYRVDRSRARNSGGSGIGLTISRHLVWAMGGDLSAASDGPGTGSTFSFTLPLAS
jgi:histidine kinase